MQPKKEGYKGSSYIALGIAAILCEAFYMYSNRGHNNMMLANVCIIVFGVIFIGIGIFRVINDRKNNKE